VDKANAQGRFTAPVGQRLLARAKQLALLLSAAAVPLQAASLPDRLPALPVVRATPALWEIRDADTTIYLFGTFHTLDSRTVWFDAEVRRAFDSSGELVLETLVPENVSAFRTTVTNAGTGKLKPFIAETQAAVGSGRALGMSIDHGADAVLRRVATDLGKPVGGLERFEDQLGTLANIPASAAAPGFKTVQPGPTVTVSDLLTAWKTGNTVAFSTMLAGFEAKSPVAYRMLIADRNARWGQWIAHRLDQPGTVFVAVGSGHLAGKDSVQSWLAARGISSTRVS
jgi:uncharacterized protein YbaP (TraB family)